MAEASELIGLDVGQKRTGLARASSLAALAEPLMTIETSKVITTIQGIVKERDVSAIIVGLPRSLQGNDTAQTAWVRQWVDEAKKKLKPPLYWQDEALTSRLAEAKVQNSKIKVQSFDEHALAAAIVLQDFLDMPEAARMLA